MNYASAGEWLLVFAALGLMFLMIVAGLALLVFGAASIQKRMDKK